MKHRLFACSLLALLAATTGCALCSSPFDYTYSAHGGKWEREDETSGRVGSLFDPAGPMPAGNSESTLPADAQMKPSEDAAAGGSMNSHGAEPPTSGPPPTNDAAPAPGKLLP